MGIPLRPQNQEFDAYSYTIERICCNDGEAETEDESTGSSSSVIQQFYEGANVLITGGTGFLGMALTEKLLRSCPGINRLFLFMRSSKGQSAEKRTTQMFRNPLFLPLLESNASVLAKVHVLEGDLEQPELGISSAQREMLKREVDIVFHIAAVGKPDETLRKAYTVNVRSTEEILALAECMPNLRAFVYNSTAFIHSHRKSEKVRESFLPSPYTQCEIETLLNSVDDVTIASITKLILGSVSSTFVLTKVMGEEVVRRKIGKLPIAIYRPSVVMNTYKEPMCGWNRYYRGVGALLIRLCSTMFRVFSAWPRHRVNIIPVDKCACALIALSWHTHSLRREKVEVTPIYNHVNDRNPVSWAEARYLVMRHFRLKGVLTKLTARLRQALENYQPFQKIKSLITHFLPPLQFSTTVKSPSSPLRLRKIYLKAAKLFEQLSHVTLKNWEFEDDNVQCLWSHMPMKDRSLFPLNVFDLDWDEYFRYVSKGFSYYVMRNVS